MEAVKLTFALQAVSVSESLTIYSKTSWTNCFISVNERDGKVQYIWYRVSRSATALQNSPFLPPSLLDTKTPSHPPTPVPAYREREYGRYFRRFVVKIFGLLPPIRLYYVKYLTQSSIYDGKIQGAANKILIDVNSAVVNSGLIPSEWPRVLEECV